LMGLAEDWRRSADGAAAVHQIRNRLQSIIIEAALLKRLAGTDPTALARIGALAQDGAGYLELFPELLPPPSLEGKAHLSELSDLFLEHHVEVRDEASELSVSCSEEALRELFRSLLEGALPFRGFHPQRLSIGPINGRRGEILVELQPGPTAPAASGVTPW